MALISSPEPMPVEVMAALDADDAVDADDVVAGVVVVDVVAAGVVLLDIAELITAYPVSDSD
jgi:hypothetical protein